MNKIQDLPFHLEDYNLNQAAPLSGKLCKNQDHAQVLFTMVSPACSTVEGIPKKSVLNLYPSTEKFMQ